DGNLSLSGKLYADLSNVASGDVTVLFLADIPDQVQLLSIYGRLKMGFRNAGGEEVYFEVPDFASPVPTSTAPTAEVVDPAPNGGSIDLGQANATVNQHNGQYYIDVTFRPP